MLLYISKKDFAYEITLRILGGGDYQGVSDAVTTVFIGEIQIGMR
jgi:hypothetical protein